MRLRVTKSKNTDIFYVIKTVYIKGKEKTIIVEKLGNILIAAHTYDAFGKSVYEYGYNEFRCIHIEF